MLLTATLSPAVSGKGSAKPPQPQAMVLDAVRDFGYLPQRAEVSHTFWLQNRGRAPLHVNKIKPGCSCTSVPTIREPIPPGDSVAIEVSFRSGRYRGRVHKKTTVYTDDPQREELELHIIADVVKNDQPAGPVMAEPFELVLEAVNDTVRAQSDTLNWTTEEEGEYRIEFVSGPDGVHVMMGDTLAVTATNPKAIAFGVPSSIAVPEISTACFGFRVIGSDTTWVTVPVTIED